MAPAISSGFQCASSLAMTWARRSGFPSIFMPWDLASIRRMWALRSAASGSYPRLVRLRFSSSEMLPGLRSSTRPISRTPYPLWCSSAISNRSAFFIFPRFCIHPDCTRGVRIQNGTDEFSEFLLPGIFNHSTFADYMHLYLAGIAELALDADRDLPGKIARLKVRDLLRCYENPNLATGLDGVGFLD